MFICIVNTLTSVERSFLEPRNSTHRQYEALRAYFIEKIPSQKVAKQFGYTPGSFRVLCHDFKNRPDREFFVSPQRGPQSSPKQDQLRERIIAFRKNNLSIYDIQRSLSNEDLGASTATISIILREEGFSKLPRRTDEERPAGPRPEAADVADARQLDLTPRRFRTRFGGLFLFVPYLARIPLAQILETAGFPGTKMIPSEHAIRSLLALKLFGNARHSHVMSSVFDEGLALFAGLNVIPKRSFLTEYSCRIPPTVYPKAVSLWFDAMNKMGLQRGVSFDLDFHTIPFHGEEALIEKHYVSKRSRRQKGLLVFLVWDAEKKHFCFVNADLRKSGQNNEIIEFVKFWKKKTGKLPEELVFDSKLTTHENLSRLNQDGIRFITLRRRSPKILHEAFSAPPSAWRRIELHNMARAYRTPRILDRPIQLNHYEGTLRQIVITDLGHEEPTILVTNQLTRSAPDLIGRYAQRMVIENGIADHIDFFHMDALSSAVAMKVDCDLQLTLMASSLYRLLGSQIGHGYETARSRHLFRDFIEATAQVSIDEKEVVVQFQKRAHNPLLLASSFHAKQTHTVPWWGRRKLRLLFG